MHARGGLATFLCVVSCAALCGAALAGCAGDAGEGGTATLPTATSPPTVTVGPATADTVPAAASTTSAPLATTTEPTAPPVTAGLVGLSPDGPWHLVDSAPGVTAPGLVYELMPKLWAVIQVEETEQSTYPWTLNEADRPIIEAYLQAQLTLYAAITSNPIDLDLPGWKQFYAGRPGVLVSLAQRKVEGQVADLDLGVVMRPQVLGDERSGVVAIVSDCMLDGAVFELQDGSLAPGSSIGIADLPWGARLELHDGRWLVAELGPIEGGCAS